MLSPLQTNIIQREVELIIPADHLDVVLHDCVDSTNTWALQQLKSGRQKPFACFAEQQTAGRGRRGKSWVSPPYSSIYMSLAWSFKLPLNKLAALSLVMGLAVARALEKTGIEPVFLKWPNDVLVQDKKIAGILVETRSSNDGIDVVIGVGLNYQMPAELMRGVEVAWTDVCGQMDAGTIIDRSKLAGMLLRECIEICTQYPHKSPALLQEFAQNYDACKQQAINVRFNNGTTLEGVALGITDRGELRVQLGNEVRVFDSAEISLRKTA